MILFYLEKKWKYRYIMLEVRYVPGLVYTVIIIEYIPNKYYMVIIYKSPGMY